MYNEENMAKVVLAADLIDRFGTKKDWRSKVNLDWLKMFNAEDCVLAQGQGNYSTMVAKFQEFDSDAFAECNVAFAEFDEEWKAYIKAFQPGSEWVGRANGSKGTIEGTFMRNGELFVVVNWRGKGVQVEQVSFFTSRWAPKQAEPPKPKYTAGRLYHSADRKLVFLFQGGNPSYGNNALRLNVDGNRYSNGLNVGDMDFYERQYGPLTEVKWNGKTVSAQIDS